MSVYNDQVASDQKHPSTSFYRGVTRLHNLSGHGRTGGIRDFIMADQAVSLVGGLHPRISRPIEDFRGMIGDTESERNGPRGAGGSRQRAANAQDLAAKAKIKKKPSLTVSSE